MKKVQMRIVFMFALLLASASGYGQTNAINKLLNKQEFEAAFEKLNSAYKDTNSAERCELLFRYYADTLNPKADFCAAYYYAAKCNEQSAERKVETSEFAKQTLARVYSLGDTDALQRFVECFSSETQYAKEAERLLAQELFTKTQQEGTLEAYEAYVERFPAAPQSSLAKREIDRLVVEQVLESDDLEVLRGFVAQNPSSQYATQAKNKIEKLVFSDALQTNTAEAYRAYLSEYPEGAYHKLASQRLGEVLYLQVTQNGRLNEYINFLKDNPNHPQWTTVYERLKSKALSQLSIAAMQFVQTKEQDEATLNEFAKQYLVDTRQQTADALLSAFPTLAQSSEVQRAEKARKTIDALLAKKTISSEDFKTNRALFIQRNNLHSTLLLRKYLTQLETAGASTAALAVYATLPLRQSKLLPFYIEQKQYSSSEESYASPYSLVSAHREEGFCFESAEDNRDIYYIRETEGGEGDMLLLPVPVNSRYNETNPVLSKDGKTLYFSSNAGLNYGGMDVYVSHRDNVDEWDNWSEPVLLGSDVNTPYNDAVLEVRGTELVVRGGKEQDKRICVFDKEPDFISGYLLDQNGEFLSGEILILDSASLDTLFITRSNDKGYFAFIRPEQAYTLHCQMNNHINFFSSDLSQVVVHSVEDLISTKKLFIAESPFMEKKTNQFSVQGKRELEYFAQSVKHLKYTITISVHVHSESKPEKALELSAKQADWIVKLLVKCGIPKERLVVVGYGNKSSLIGWEGKNRIEIGFLNE